MQGSTVLKEHDDGANTLVIVVEPVEADSRGLVDPATALEHFTLDRRAPAPPVARFIDRYWFVSWDLPPGAVHYQEVVLHPVVNVVFEGGGGAVGGPRDERFVRGLRGRGSAVGVMSRPGGFAAFTDIPAADLRNTQLPIGDVFGEEGQAIAASLGGDPGVEAATTILDEWLSRLAPPDEHPCEQAIAVADIVIGDPAISSVEQLAGAAGVSVRQVQRLFTTHVGLSPKQVIRRYRIYEVAERVAHGEVIGWAELAVELGFADQAHLTREFTSMFGMPPGMYARMASPA